MTEHVGKRGHFKLDHDHPNVTISCTLCGQKVETFHEAAVMLHILSAHQYSCPRCDVPASAKIEPRGVDRDSLVLMQDAFVESAKENMRQDGYVQRYAFVVTSRARALHATESISKDARLIPLCEHQFHEAEQPDDAVQLAIPLSLNPGQLLSYIAIIQPAAVALISALVREGKKSGGPKVLESVAEKMMKKFDTDPEQLFAAMVWHTVAQTQARAVLSVGDGWQAQRPIDGEGPIVIVPETIRDAPDAIEVVVSTIESALFTRTVVVPVLRRDGYKRGEGPVIGFGEPLVVDSLLNPELTLMGLDFGMFHPREVAQA